METEIERDTAMTYRQKMGFDRTDITPLQPPTPKLILSREMRDGKKAIRVTVICNTEILGITDGLGYQAVDDQTNTRTILCSTPAELDAARNPIMRFFGHKGEYLG